MEKKIDCLGLRDRPLGREANRINAEQRFVGAVSQKSFQARDHSRAPSLGRFQRCQPFLKRIFVNHSACSPELNLYNSKARKFAQKLPVTSDVGFCTAEPPMTVSYYCNKYRGSGRKQKKSTSFTGRYRSLAKCSISSALWTAIAFVCFDITMCSSCFKATFQSR